MKIGISSCFIYSIRKYRRIRAHEVLARSPLTSLSPFLPTRLFRRTQRKRLLSRRLPIERSSAQHFSKRVFDVPPSIDAMHSIQARRGARSFALQRFAFPSLFGHRLLRLLPLGDLRENRTSARHTSGVCTPPTTRVRLADASKFPLSARVRGGFTSHVSPLQRAHHQPSANQDHPPGVFAAFAFTPPESAVFPGPAAIRRWPDCFPIFAVLP